MVTHKIKTTISAITCRYCGFYSYYVHDLSGWMRLSKDKMVGTCRMCSYEKMRDNVYKLLNSNGL